MEMVTCQTEIQKHTQGGGGGGRGGEGTGGGGGREGGNVQTYFLGFWTQFSYTESGHFYVITY